MSDWECKLKKKKKGRLPCAIMVFILALLFAVKRFGKKEMR